LYSNFEIPEAVKNKVPRFWINFVEDAYNELSKVKNGGYDG
jgi:hypothetical protein